MHLNGALAPRQTMPARFRLTGNKKGGGHPPFSDFGVRLSKAVIELELERMGRHAEGRQLLFLERNIRIQHVVREDAPTGEEFAVLIELFQRLLERVAYLGYSCSELGRQIVKVLVDRVAGKDLVLYAVDSRHQHGGKSEVRVWRRIGETHFDAAY